MCVLLLYHQKRKWGCGPLKKMQISKPIYDIIGSLENKYDILKIGQKVKHLGINLRIL